MFPPDIPLMRHQKSDGLQLWFGAITEIIAESGLKHMQTGLVAEGSSDLLWCKRLQAEVKIYI